jgi:GTPase SAR1 family protein
MQKLPIFFVGTKSDLSEQRMIPMEQIFKFCNDNNILYKETSSKLNINVDDCILSCVKEIKKFEKKNKLKKINLNDKKENCLIS